MSKIIKAAQLQILVPDKSDQIFLPEAVISADSSEMTQQSEGTILQAANLLDDAKKKAADIIEMAEQQAEEIIAKAEAEKAKLENELDQLIQQAQQDGYAAGYQEGLDDAYQDVNKKTEQFLAELEVIIEAAVKERSAALNRLEEDFLKLGVLVAEKLIKREIESDPAWLVPTLRAGLEQLTNHEYVTIRVNPDTYEILAESTSFADIFSGKISWESDPALARQDCIIETEFGAVDASLDTRFAKLSAALKEQIYAE